MDNIDILSHAYFRQLYCHMFSDSDQVINKIKKVNVHFSVLFVCTQLF